MTICNMAKGSIIVGVPAHGHLHTYTHTHTHTHTYTPTHTHTHLHTHTHTQTHTHAAAAAPKTCSVNPWAHSPLLSNVPSLPHYLSFNAIGTGSGILGYWCWCPSPFPLSPSISRCFSIHSSHAIGFHSCFFFATDVSAPIQSTLHMLMANFQAWDWL